MKLPFIYNVPEGGKMYQGVNWRSDWASKFLVCFRLWRFSAYFRLRSKNIQGKRIVWGLDFFRPDFWMFGSKIGYSFDCHCITRDGKPFISLELLQDMGYTDKAFRFKREEDYIRVEVIEDAEG